MSTLWLIGNLSNYVDTVVLLFILNIICGSGVGVGVGVGVRVGVGPLL